MPLLIACSRATRRTGSRVRAPAPAVPCRKPQNASPAGCRLLRRGAAWLACLAMALSAASVAQGTETLDAGTVKIRFEPQDRQLAELARNAVPDARARVEGRLGLRMEFAIEITLLPDSLYRRWVPDMRGEWSAAVAWPSKAAIVVNTGRVDLANNVYETLIHEMVHLLLGMLETRTRNRIPLWFHEGAAQWVAGSLFRGSQGELAVAAAGGEIIPLGDLCEEFPEEPGMAGIAYAEAHDAVLVMERDHGPGAVARVVDEFARGTPFPDAVKKATGLTGEEFAAKWKDGISSGPPYFLLYLGDNPWMIFVLLMAACGVALVIGFARYRRRRSRIMKLWEEEEKLEEP